MAQRSYKFMTNILSEAKHRTRYVKLLKDITPDAQVSYQRILIALGLLTAVTMFFFFSLRNSSGKLGYVIAPIALISVGLLLLIVIYIISSREKSMLSSVVDYITFQFTENSRRKVSKNASVKNIGISHVNSTNEDGSGRGIIHFTNGDVGNIYSIEGQLSLSVLPSVVNATADARTRYFATRMPTTTEYMLTAVKRSDVESKLENLSTIYNNAEVNNDEFSSGLSDIIYGYVEKEVGEKENQVFQSLIIREIDHASLQKACRYFEDAVSSGMYAYAEPLTARQAVDRLKSVSMLSTQGARKLIDSIEAEKD